MNLANLILDEQIKDEDISEIKDLKLDDERKEFLKVLNNCDVQACPGAGKTTLVGAKLAILSKKWKSNKQGICILSHTNVAKDEIIKRLEKTASGSRLLSAPHFIGTIQTFVNQFLAIPYMRDILGCKYQFIDDDICKSKITNLLSWNSKNYFEKKQSKKLHEFLQFSDTSLMNSNTLLSTGLKDVTKPIYLDVKKAKEKLIEQGIHFYNDMFWIARKYIEESSKITEIISQRFPLVLIDEMQDTDRLQNSVLEKMFQKSVVQRVGDSDQTLKEDCGWKDEQNKIIINGSFRFGQAIADCAKTFSSSKLDLKGNREAEKGIEFQKPVIILFDISKKEEVLESFAKLLFEKFGDSLWDTDGKQKIIKAVCPQHEKTDKDKVKSLKCYYPAYSEAEGTLKKKEKHYFNNFIEYCHMAKKLKLQCEDQKLIIQKLQDGLVQALFKAYSQESFEFRKVHNEMNSFFKKSESIEKRKALLNILQENNLPTEDIWNSKVKQIKETLEKRFSLYINSPQSLSDFFKFISNSKLLTEEKSQNLTNKQACNIAKFINDSKEIEIELSTIHSAKGQTHFTTLVLFGTGGGKNLLDIKNKQFQTKMKENVYVALTRSSHFLCLALPSDKFNKASLSELCNDWKIENLTNISSVNV